MDNDEITDVTFEELKTLDQTSDRFKAVEALHVGWAMELFGTEELLMPRPEVIRQVRAVPTKMSVAHYQLTRLLQHFVCADVEGRLPKPVSDDPQSNALALARSRYAELEGIAETLSDGPEAALDWISDSQAFSALRLGQLGKLCGHAHNFYRAESMQRKMFKDEQTNALQVGVLLGLRNGPGYSLPEALAGRFKEYIDDDSAYVTESAHLHFTEAVGSLLVELKKARFMHPTTFLARLLEFDKEIKALLAEEKRELKDTWQVKDGADWVNISDHFDALVHVFYLDLRFCGSARLTLSRAAIVADLSYSKDPENYASKLRKQADERPWIKTFREADDVVENYEGLALLASIGFARFHQSLRWMEETIEEHRTGSIDNDVQQRRK